MKIVDPESDLGILASLLKVYKSGENFAATVIC